VNRKQFAIYGVLITLVVGVVVGYSVSEGNIWSSVIAVVIGIILLTLGKRRVEEVIEDERIHQISEKASRKTLQIFGIASALLGLTLITLKELTEVGYTLAFSASILVILYLIFYAYYSRKTLD
jgi:uncharacterized membrane protein